MSRLPFFYGWVMLPAVMLVSICTSPGQTFGVSVFNPYIQESLGLSSSELSGAYMLGTMLASLPLFWVGALMDRHGPRRVLIGVVILFGLTCMGMRYVSGWASLFAIFFFLRFLGQGSMSMLARNALAMWFERRLGFASGLSNIGMAAAVGGVPALGFMLIDAYGWRGAYEVFGLGIWILLLPLVAFVFRDRPEDMGQELDGGATNMRREESEQIGRDLRMDQVLRTRSYWIAVACMSSWSMSGTGAQFHIVSIFAERALGAGPVAVMFSLYAAVIAGARLVGGILADRIALNGLMAVSMIFQGLGLAALNAVPAPQLPYVYAVIFALGSGLLMSVSETIWPRYYGRAHLGKIRGSVSTIGVAASGVGPFILGVGHDVFGSFAPALWACAALCVPLAVLGLWATEPRS
jgi:MFS family permease